MRQRTEKRTYFWDREPQRKLCLKYEACLTSDHAANPFCRPSLWKVCSQLVKDPAGYQVLQHTLFWGVLPGSPLVPALEPGRAAHPHVIAQAKGTKPWGNSGAHGLNCTGSKHSGDAGVQQTLLRPSQANSLLGPLTSEFPPLHPSHHMFTEHLLSTSHHLRDAAMLRIQCPTGCLTNTQKTDQLAEAGRTE